MAENERFGRRPCQVVEIDQDFCTRTYGQAPCNASLSENLLRHSENLTNAYWSKTNLLVTTGPTIDGFQFFNCDRNATASGGFINVFDDIPQDFFDKPVTFSIFAGKTATDRRLDINFIQDVVQQDDTNQTSAYRVEFSLQTGQVVEVEKEDQVQNQFTEVLDRGAYWVIRISFQTTVPNVKENTIGPVVFLDDDGAADPTLLETVQLSGFQAYGGSDFVPYAKTESEIKVKTGTDKCFNTRSTCQDPANYDKGVQVLKFVEKQSPIPTDDYYRPSVKARGVRVTPARLNPGGADRNARALGQRASVSVSFQDHPDNDRIVDKYRAERDYDPAERGTFWTKWRARNPYYMQRPLRLRSGYLVGGQLVDETTREFVITGFSGPDNQGNVTIQGKDVLTLAEDEKAQAPIASRGKLAASITAGATSATLTPAGIGDAEYPASGEIRVGKEVISFTRTGDNLTLTRGQFGTEAKAHDEDDTVQLCLRYVSEAPQDILYDLLLNYANIPASYLDKAQWDAEALDFLPRLYSAIITEPNGVSQLISEMCQQMYFTIWWDERLGKVLLKSVRLAQEDEVFELDDTKHLIADSVSWKDLSDELITQVWVYYGQLDPTEKLDQGSNYATIAITADPSAEGADKHNLRRIKTIFSRWIDATNASAAEDLGQRILNRYGNAPRQVTFKVDAKDNYLWLGNYIRLTNRLRVDQFGQVTPVNLQIFQAEETSLGSEFQFTAQEFIPALIGGDQVEDPDERVIPITSDLLNVNLRTLHDSLFGAPEGSEKITFVIREGVTIGGDAAGGGVNVPAAARVTVNDFYDAGNSAAEGFAVGQVPILQRAGLGSVRTTNAGGTTPETPFTLDYKLIEYPTSVALRTGTWPSGVSVALIVEAGAAVVGEGGNGSAHVTSAAANFSGYRAGDGGDALLVESPITITNGGQFAGGGGGGASVTSTGDATAPYYLTAGGAGAGYAPAKTKGNIFRPPGSFISLRSNSTAGAGSSTAPGSGGVLGWRDSANADDYQARAGSGGSLAVEGALSSLTINSETVTYAGTNSTGAAGKAVRSGAASIEWVNKGDVRGDEVA